MYFHDGRYPKEVEKNSHCLASTRTVPDSPPPLAAVIGARDITGNNSRQLVTIEILYFELCIETEVTDNDNS